MSKLHSRIVAIFLVPCLLVDPALAATFNNSLSPTRERVGVRGEISRRYIQEALAAKLASSTKNQWQGPLWLWTGIVGPFLASRLGEQSIPPELPTAFRQILHTLASWVRRVRLNIDSYYSPENIARNMRPVTLEDLPLLHLLDLWVDENGGGLVYDKGKRPLQGALPDVGIYWQGKPLSREAATRLRELDAHFRTLITNVDPDDVSYWEEYRRLRDEAAQELEAQSSKEKTSKPLAAAARTGVNVSAAPDLKEQDPGAKPTSAPTELSLFSNPFYRRFIAGLETLPFRTGPFFVAGQLLLSVLLSRMHPLAIYLLIIFWGLFILRPMLRIAHGGFVRAHTWTQQKGWRTGISDRDIRSSHERYVDPLKIIVPPTVDETMLHFGLRQLDKIQMPLFILGWFVLHGGLDWNGWQLFLGASALPVLVHYVNDWIFQYIESHPGRALPWPLRGVDRLAKVIFRADLGHVELSLRKTPNPAAVTVKEPSKGSLYSIFKVFVEANTWLSLDEIALRTGLSPGTILRAIYRLLNVWLLEYQYKKGEAKQFRIPDRRRPHADVILSVFKTLPGTTIRTKKEMKKLERQIKSILLGKSDSTLLVQLADLQAELGDVSGLSLTPRQLEVLKRVQAGERNGTQLGKSLQPPVPRQSIHTDAQSILRVLNLEKVRRWLAAERLKAHESDRVADNSESGSEPDSAAAAKPNDRSEDDYKKIDRAFAQANQLSLINDSIEIEGRAHGIPIVLGCLGSIIEYTRIGSAIHISDTMKIPAEIAQDLRRQIFVVDSEASGYHSYAIPAIGLMKLMNLEGAIVEDDGIDGGVLSHAALTFGAKRIIGIDINLPRLRLARQTFKKSGFAGRWLDKARWPIPGISDKDQYVLIHDDFRNWFRAIDSSRSQAGKQRPTVRVADVGYFYKEAHEAIIRQMLEARDGTKYILSGYIDTSDEHGIQRLQKRVGKHWKVTMATFHGCCAVLVEPTTKVLTSAQSGSIKGGGSAALRNFLLAIALIASQCALVWSQPLVNPTLRTGLVFYQAAGDDLSSLAEAFQEECAKGRYIDTVNPALEYMEERFLKAGSAAVEPLIRVLLNPSVPFAQELAFNLLVKIRDPRAIDPIAEYIMTSGDAQFGLVNIMDDLRKWNEEAARRVVHIILNTQTPQAAEAGIRFLEVLRYYPQFKVYFEMEGQTEVSEESALQKLLERVPENQQDNVVLKHTSLFMKNGSLWAFARLQQAVQKDPAVALFHLEGLAGHPQFDTLVHFVVEQVVVASPALAREQMEILAPRYPWMKPYLRGVEVLEKIVNRRMGDPARLLEAVVRELARPATAHNPVLLWAAQDAARQVQIGVNYSLDQRPDLRDFSALEGLNADGLYTLLALGGGSLKPVVIDEVLHRLADTTDLKRWRSLSNLYEGEKFQAFIEIVRNRSAATPADATLQSLLRMLVKVRPKATAAISPQNFQSRFLLFSS